MRMRMIVVNHHKLLWTSMIMVLLRHRYEKQMSSARWKMRAPLRWGGVHGGSSFLVEPHTTPAGLLMSKSLDLSGHVTTKEQRSRESLSGILESSILASRDPLSAATTSSLGIKSAVTFEAGKRQMVRACTCMYQYMYLRVHVCTCTPLSYSFYA